MSLPDVSISGKKPKQAPNFSTLPPDVLTEILRQVSIEDLIHISETCRTLYTAATSEQQFWQRIPNLHHQINGISPASIAYRRLRSLRLQPLAHTAWLICTVYGHNNNNNKSQLNIIGTVGDTVVIYDGQMGCVIGFPDAWLKNIGKDMEQNLIMVGNARLAIVHGNEVAQSFQLVNVHSGKCVGENVQIDSSAPVEMSSHFTNNRLPRVPQVAMSAGADGDHILFVSRGTATVVRLKDGHIIRRETVEADAFSSLVRGVDGKCYNRYSCSEDNRTKHNVDSTF